MERNEISEMETDWKGSGKNVSMERKVTKLEKTWNRCGEEKEKMGKDRNRMAIVILHCGNPYEPDSFIGFMGPQLPINLKYTDPLKTAPFQSMAEGVVLQVESL